MNALAKQTFLFSLALAQVALLIWLPSANVFADTAPNEEGLFPKALELFQAKKYAESRAILESLTKANPNRALYWFNLGNNWFMAEAFQNAAESYRRVIALASPLSPAAELYLAKCERHLGHPSEASALLEKLKTQTLPPRLTQEVAGESEALEEGVFSEGLALYRTGDYEKALAYFEAAIKREPSAELYQMKALALVQLGQVQQAAGAFVYVLSLPGSPEVKERARFFLRQLYSGLSGGEKPGWLSLDVALGYNSNVFSDGLTDSPTRKAISDIAVNAGYHFLLGHPVSFRVTNLVNWDNTLGIPSNRLVGDAVDGKLIWAPDEWRFSVGPTLEYQRLYDQDYFGRTGVQVQLLREIGAAQASLQYDLVNTISMHQVFDYLEGVSHALRAQIAFYGPSTFFAASYNYIADNSGAMPWNGGLLPIGNHSYGPSIVASWFPTPATQLRFDASYLKLDYLRPAFPSGIDRRDRELSGQVKLWYSLTSNLRYFASVAATVNESTLGASSQLANKNFTQWVITSGLSWNLIH